VISISDDKAKKEVHSTDDAIVTEQDLSLEEVNPDNELVEHLPSLDQVEIETLHLDLPDVVTDSSDLTDTERQIIEWQAQKAEYNAKRSLINSSIFVPSVALGILGSFLIGSSIPFFAGLLIGLAFMILGILLYIRSSKSRYITEKGEKFLRWALVGVILNSLAIAGLITFIFLL